MNQLDRIGTFQGTVVSSGVSTTKNGYPQWVAILKANKLYVEDAATMQHYGITEAGYVDYPEETITGFFVLFGKDGELMNYQKVQDATGWDGTAFDTIPGIAEGKTVMFRVEEDTYEGKTSNKVKWIDAADASPNRTVKNLDAAELKSLTAKFITKKAKVVAAKAPTSTAATVQAVTPAPAKTEPAAPVAAPKKTTKKSPPSLVSRITSAISGSVVLPETSTKLDAWNKVNEYKGDIDDAAITDAWVTACGEIGGDRTEDQFAETDWASVRDAVIKTCKLVVA